MSKTINDGGPAFPIVDCDKDNCPHTSCKGMSLRAYFAGQALAGVVGGCSGFFDKEPSAYATGHCNAVLADRAVALADALIARLEKP